MMNDKRQQNSAITCVIGASSVFLAVFACAFFASVLYIISVLWIGYMSEFRLSNDYVNIPIVLSAWGHILLYLTIAVYCFQRSVSPSHYHHHYVSLGLLSYVFLIAAVGGLAIEDKVVQAYQPLGHVWLIIMICACAYFTSIWTGFWFSVGTSLKDGGKILALLSILAVLAAGFIGGNATHNFVYPLMLPILGFSFIWIGQFFFEKPLRRLLSTSSLILLWVGLVWLYLEHNQFILAAKQTAYAVQIGASFPAILGAFWLLLKGRAELIVRPNIHLAAQLKAREEELARSRAALEEETKKRVLLEERDRLVRDMHDGIGGQMLSLLVRLRSGKVKDGAIEQELEGCLTDLRLIVDSLDASSEEFSVAMSAFFHRAAEQLEAAKMKLVWKQEEAAFEHVHFGIADTLNISRFLQEAVTNVIRHSGASHMSIRIKKASPYSIRFDIEDNGCGIADLNAACLRGKGLRNMQKRADALNAQLDVKREAYQMGLCLVLIIPVS